VLQAQKRIIIDGRGKRQTESFVFRK